MMTVRQLIKDKIDILEDRASSENNEGRWVEDEKCRYAIEVLEELADKIAALKADPCEDAVSQKIDEFKLKGKTAEIWIVKGKLQIRYLGAIHNIPLPPVTPKPRWIPVSERLPEDGRYLCTYKNDEGICIDFGRVIDGAWYVIPTAWMPLPEPYKEGESE